MAAVIPPVQLPFPSYKWRWMETVPVETFNRLDILLGVTRAIQACEGLSANSAAFDARMEGLQDDFFPDRLAGQPYFPQLEDGRSLIRRQGGYWRGLGLLSEQNAANLQLTPLGHDFATGKMTADDFVQWTVQHHELPGTVIRSPANRQPWEASGITVRPLAVIVAVLLELARDDAAQAYLTTMELAKVLVPLQLVWPDASDLARAVLRFRENPIAFAHLPDCASGANDLRMLREHLLFLHNGGLLSLERVGQNRYHRFGLPHDDAAFAAEMANLQAEEQQGPPDPAVNTIEIVQRARKMVEVLNRPGQAKFRSQILANCDGRCVLSGEQLPEVLVACHIHEVKDGGSDHVSNGILLRADLHVLFDCNKIRIGHDGQVVFAPDVSACATYGALPDQIALPQNLNAEALRRRFLYGAVLAHGDD